MTGYSWRCSCGEAGTVDKPYATDTSNDDAKHQAACVGSVWTSSAGGVLERVSVS